MPTNPMGGGQIGRSRPRLEAREKVTGRAEYTHLMRLPGMLYGKIFRSTVPHGRIKSVDTSAAKKIPGVFRVITAQDVRKVIPDPYYGPAFHDQPILAMDKVRFVGEPVAVVLAADPHVAEAAVQAITAEYEELEPIYDEVEAMTSASHVHDELKPAASFADLKHLKGTKDTNLALQAKTRRGDVDKAFAEAAHVFAHEFRTCPPGSHVVGASDGAPRRPAARRPDDVGAGGDGVAAVALLARGLSRRGRAGGMPGRPGALRRRC